MVKPIVALVGRPNVGKSALFNRIVGRRQAIVEDTPGTTRDRIYAEADWGGVDFLLVDTGGLEVIPASPEDRRDWQPLATASAAYLPAMRAQAEIAIREADAIILVVDAASGLTATDEAVGDILRRTEKPVVLAANKADNQTLRQSAAEFYCLGLGEPYPVSALHGSGTGDLLDAVVEHLRGGEPAEEEEVGARLAIVGRPNVGKSSLLNSILGEERAIVSEIAGTTRDAIDTTIELEGMPVVLIDTAGIRRRGHIEQGIEQYSVLRALKAIERADVALLVLDATQPATAQDAHVAGYILDARKSAVVTVSKADLVSADPAAREALRLHVRQELKFLDYVPIEFVSSKTGDGVLRLLATALCVHEQRHRRVTTAELNHLIREAIPKTNPPSKAGRHLRVYYGSQVRSDPPTFVFFVNDRRLAHFGFTRFLENQIRERHPFTGTPIQIEYRDDKSKER